MENSGMLMDQKIFEMGLDVEVVSVYLLCTGLAESDTELTFEALTGVWNGSEASLIQGLEALAGLNIIETDATNTVRQIFNAAMWKGSPGK